MGLYNFTRFKRFALCTEGKINGSTIQWTDNENHPRAFRRQRQRRIFGR